jgi:ABC-2 type transport system permease protein
MMGSIAAQLLVLSKRTSTWILMGIWVVLGIMFSHLLPYLTYSGNADSPGGISLETMLPGALEDNLLAGFPFFGGVFALMLGVLSIGSDYGWDTLKTLLTQRSGRLRLLFSKVVALAGWLVPFVLTLFVVGAGASYLIAAAENATVEWPTLWELGRAFLAGWFILATWAALGVLLAVLSRGTALAIGLGIVYTFVIEGVFSALAGQVSWLESLVEYFLRANAYSLTVAIGVPIESLGDNGPGGFFGPFVDGGQAIIGLGAYMATFLFLSAAVFRRRDVG